MILKEMEKALQDKTATVVDEKRSRPRKRPASEVDGLAPIDAKKAKPNPSEVSKIRFLAPHKHFLICLFLTRTD